MSVIEELDSAIKNLSFRPKGVKLGISLFKELYKLNRITENVDMFAGMPSGCRGFFLDKDIYVITDFFIEDWEYILPTKES